MKTLWQRGSQDGLETVFVLPISREWLLDRILEWMNADVPTDTALLFVIDNRLLEDDVLMLIQESTRGYESVQVLSTGDLPLPENGIIEHRRQRITELWQGIAEHVNTDYLFGLEDDTLPPRGAFKKLVARVESGECDYASGVEIGRHGVKYLGAWNIEGEVYKTPPFQSGGTLSINGGGLYCFATMTDHVRKHDWRFETVGMGPDMIFVNDITKRGKKAVADFDVLCDHVDQYGKIYRPEDGLSYTFGIKIKDGERVFYISDRQDWEVQK